MWYGVTESNRFKHSRESLGIIKKPKIWERVDKGVIWTY